MAAKDKNEDPEVEAQPGVAQGPEVVRMSPGAGPTTGSAAAPDVNSGIDRGERDPDAEPLDPVYNMPESAFLPTVEGLDDASQAAILGNMRASSVDMRAAKLTRVVQGREAAAADLEAAEERRKMIDKANPLPKVEHVALDPAAYRAREFARVQAEAQTIRSNTTIPGGRFMVGGEWVNCNGDKIDEDGNILVKRSLTA